MRILSIGNSFSQDAQSYLHAIAKSKGEDFHTVNLFIGGCPLSLHAENLRTGAAAYDYEVNGGPCERKASIQDAVNEGGWDVITLQQSSGVTGFIGTYFPHINELADYLKESAPASKIYIHETWAYEKDAWHPDFPRYDKDQAKMHRMLSAAYHAAAYNFGYGILPVGECINALRENPEFDIAQGGISLCRDGYHLSMTLGRYTAGAIWYEILTGDDIRECPFRPEGNEDERLYEIIRKTVHEVCEAYKAI